MKPHIGLPVTVFGGLENSLYEHAGIVTFVHKDAPSTLDGQLGSVNVRILLDGQVADRALRFVPLVATRREAIDLNASGAGWVAFLPQPDEPDVTPQQDGPPRPRNPFHWVGDFSPSAARPSEPVIN
jgi:hypothetical protein